MLFRGDQVLFVEEAAANGENHHRPSVRKYQSWSFKIEILHLPHAEFKLTISVSIDMIVKQLFDFLDHVQYKKTIIR